jgi:hypothetical protein
MVDWMPGILQTTVAAHELTHALQDQYFNLEAFVDERQFFTDQLLARSALVEGDATAVMLDFTRAMVGQGPLAKEKDVEAAMMQNVIGASLSGGLSNVPQSLQMILIFPYTSGLRFAHELIKRGGYKEIDRAFNRPPKSTKEILHPDKYVRGTAAFQVIPIDQLNTPELSPQAKLVYQDSLGEFGVAALLGMFSSEKERAAKIAAGWNGDLAAIFEDGADRIIAWKTEWEYVSSAKDFYKEYLKILAVRFPGKDLKDNDTWVETNPGHKIKIKQQGQQVTLWFKRVVV